MAGLARVLGENGAPAVSDPGVGDAKLALFNKLVRDLPAPSLELMLSAAVEEAKASGSAAAVVDLFVLVMQTRDVRGGKGERALAFRMLLQLHPHFPLTVQRLLLLLPEYGSWKDLKLLLELAEGQPSKPKFARTNEMDAEDAEEGDATPTAAAAPAVAAAVRDVVVKAFADQLRADAAALQTSGEHKKAPSLAAKWAPREGKHFNSLAKALAEAMFPKHPAAQRSYRLLVSSLTKALDVAETHMTSGTWASIKPGAVPSRCLKINRHALANQAHPYLRQKPWQSGRRRQANPQAGQTRFPDNMDRVACAAALAAHLEAAKKDPTAKGVHGAALHPHEVVAQYMRVLGGEEDDEVLEAQWRDIRAKAAAGGVLGKLVPLVDVSGSMSGTPMEVAVALGILLSEITHEALRNRFITFDASPQWHVLNPADSLRAKVRSTMAAEWGGSTDFEAAIRLILDAAVAARLDASAFEGLVLVTFSDMQFDCAQHGYESWATQHERLATAFAAAGRAAGGEPYPVPHMVYWNLRGDTDGHAAASDTPGVSLLSGFSPSMLKLFLAGRVEELTDPGRTLREVLDVPRYDAVRAACAEVGEGPMAKYVCPNLEPMMA